MRPLLLLLTSASAYRTGQTKIQRREPWVVAERFCFEGRATFDYSIKTRGATRMYVYGSKDQKSFREKVDKKSYQTLSMQKRFERADTEVVLTPGMTTSGKLKFAVDSGQTFVHVVIANFNASCNAICQDQFSCNAEFSKRCYGPVEAEYEMTFLDGAAEHGRDERGANVLYGVFAALYVLFVGLACAVEGLLVQEDKRHATCRILFRSVWVSALSIWFRMLHHAIYANDGKGAPKLVNAAMAFTLLADSGVLLSLALCAEGWRIVRRKIAVRGRIRVALLITTYVIAAACIWGWYVSSYKHSTSPTLRETAPGRGLVGLRVVAGVIVGARLLQQADRFLASKREFYQVLFFLIGGWSAVWPVALIAATVARPADKDMAFDGCLVVAEFLVQALLVYCCKPGSPLFPFHANVVNCVEIKILRRARAESSRRPPRHRRDACSIAWRCRFLNARPSQDGRVVAEE